MRADLPGMASGPLRCTRWRGARGPGGGAGAWGLRGWPASRERPRLWRWGPRLLSCWPGLVAPSGPGPAALAARRPPAPHGCPPAPPPLSGAVGIVPGLPAAGVPGPRGTLGPRGGELGPEGGTRGAGTRRESFLPGPRGAAGWGARAPAPRAARGWRPGRRGSAPHPVLRPQALRPRGGPGGHCVRVVSNCPGAPRGGARPTASAVGAPLRPSVCRSPGRAPVRLASPPARPRCVARSCPLSAHVVAGRGESRWPRPSAGRVPRRVDARARRPSPDSRRAHDGGRPLAPPSRRGALRPSGTDVGDRSSSPRAGRVGRAPGGRLPPSSLRGFLLQSIAPRPTRPGPRARFSGEGHGNPLQYSCLEKPMDRGARRATVHGSLTL